MQRAYSLIPAALIEKARRLRLAPTLGIRDSSLATREEPNPENRVPNPGRPQIERLLMEGVLLIALGEVHDPEIAMKFIESFEKYFSRDIPCENAQPLPMVAAANESRDPNRESRHFQGKEGDDGDSHSGAGVCG